MPRDKIWKRGDVERKEIEKERLLIARSRGKRGKTERVSVVRNVFVELIIGITVEVNVNEEGVMSCNAGTLVAGTG